MHSIYEDFYKRIPNQLLASMSRGCELGDKAYRQVMESDPELSRSQYMYGLRSRIHDKAVQMYLHDRIAATGLVQVQAKHTGFGNRVLMVSGTDFSLIPCHTSEHGALPSAAKYKIKACQHNPGNDYGQQDLFAPPYSESFSNLHFFMTFYFHESFSEPTIILPDKTFTSILHSWSLPAIVAADSVEPEIAIHERVMPKLLSEVKNEKFIQQNG